MTTKTNTVEKNSSTVKSTSLKSPWNRAIVANSEWPDKVSAFFYDNIKGQFNRLTL